MMSNKLFRELNKWYPLTQFCLVFLENKCPCKLNFRCRDLTTCIMGVGSLMPSCLFRDLSPPLDFPMYLLSYKSFAKLLISTSMQKGGKSTLCSPFKENFKISYTKTYNFSYPYMEICRLVLWHLHICHVLHSLLPNLQKHDSQVPLSCDLNSHCHYPEPSISM